MHNQASSALNSTLTISGGAGGAGGSGGAQGENKSVSHVLICYIDCDCASCAVNAIMV